MTGPQMGEREIEGMLAAQAREAAWSPELRDQVRAFREDVVDALYNRAYFDRARPSKKGYVHIVVVPKGVDHAEWLTAHAEAHP
jgi:hypothetical protein